jgi:hypothetical protein
MVRDDERKARYQKACERIEKALMLKLEMKLKPKAWSLADELDGMMLDDEDRALVEGWKVGSIEIVGEWDSAVVEEEGADGNGVGDLEMEENGDADIYQDQAHEHDGEYDYNIGFGLGTSRANL